MARHEALSRSGRHKQVLRHRYILVRPWCGNTCSHYPRTPPARIVPSPGGDTLLPMADFDTTEFRAARFDRRSATERSPGAVPDRHARLRPACGRRVRRRRCFEIVEELEAGSRERVRRAAEARGGRRGDRRASSSVRTRRPTRSRRARARRPRAGSSAPSARRSCSRQQADAYAEQVVVDTRLLWEERQRLIEDIRQLADDVLRTAEDAHERVTLPEMLAEPEPETRRADRDEPARRATGPTTAHGRGGARRPARRSGARRRRVGHPTTRTARASASARAAACRGALRPVEALLFVALREVPNDFEKRRPIGPGALPPARWPTPSVRSTPRCGWLDRRGIRNASTSRTMQTATMMAMVMAPPVPARPLPQTA